MEEREWNPWCVKEKNLKKKQKNKEHETLPKLHEESANCNKWAPC